MLPLFAARWEGETGPALPAGPVSFPCPHQAKDIGANLRGGFGRHDLVRARRQARQVSVTLPEGVGRPGRRSG